MEENRLYLCIFKNKNIIEQNFNLKSSLILLADMTS